MFPPPPEAEEPQRTAVLVVDDDCIERQLISAVLRTSYQVLEAENATQALHWLDLATLDDIKHCSVKAVILDILMPGLNGLQLLKVIKKTYQVPVIMLTALSEARDIRAALQNGADDYVVKPWSARDLVTRVNRWVGSGRTGARPGGAAWR